MFPRVTGYHAFARVFHNHMLAAVSFVWTRTKTLRTQSHTRTYTATHIWMYVFISGFSYSIFRLCSQPHLFDLILLFLYNILSSILFSTSHHYRPSHTLGLLYFHLYFSSSAISFQLILSWVWTISTLTVSPKSPQLCLYRRMDSFLTPSNLDSRQLSLHSNLRFMSSNILRSFWS